MNSYDENEKELSALVIRGFTGTLGVLGQFYTVRETIYLLFDLYSGTVEPRFYVALLTITIVFPFSVWLLLRSVSDSDFVRVAINIYAFALASISAAYYFAISGNYSELINSLMQSITPSPSHGPLTAHIALFVILGLPIAGTLAFASRAGRTVCGVAAIPLLATFLYGITALASQLRRNGDLSHFASGIIPQIAMLMIVFFVGLTLFTRYLPSK